MTERLLQFIWQFRYYNNEKLVLNTGEPFHVIHPGMVNHNQGPDFLEAKIRSGNTIWVGHVEIHITTSCWHKHAHGADPNYDNVILHVVWEDDLSLPINGIPVFTLQHRVPKLLLQQYESWMNNRAFIACEQQIAQVNGLIVTAWKERLLVERLQRKTTAVLFHLQQNQHHWEETLWWMLARNFGGRVNAEAFEAIARSLPLTIIAKHRQQLRQLEALLMGQAGLLDRSFVEEYPNLLKNDYVFYKRKYDLASIAQPVHFLRMRPVSFPTLRLAQLAMLLHTTHRLFARIKETIALEELRALLDVTASEFWDYHYTFSEAATYRPKRVGAQVADTIIINTVIPVLFAYGHLHGEELFKHRALKWLEETAAEQNNLTKGFGNLAVANNNAFDSQALIELKTMYCDQRKCLDCAVGNALLRANMTTNKSAN